MTYARPLQEALGVRFRDEGLLRLALTHSSYLNENPGEFPESNERLEFLGDAVISLAAAEELYAANPHWSEGTLTQARAALVQEAALAEAARRLDLGRWFRMGKGEDAGGGRGRPSNLSAGLEALVGAVFLDGGYDAAKNVVLRVLADSLSSLDQPRIPANPKSLLLEAAQANGLLPPIYRIVEEGGAAHAPMFVAEVSVGGKVAGVGRGRRKALAEQAAAKNALEAFPGQAVAEQPLE